MKNQLVKLALFLGGAVIVALILGAVLQSCTPVRITEVYTTDSTGKTTKTVTKYYPQNEGYSVQPDIHVITTPLFYNRVSVPVFVPIYRTPAIRGYNSSGFRHRH
jgi:hypothetical protein